MTIYYLSRVHLREDASVKALLPLLTADKSLHSLVWSLFAETPSQKRDFLFRDAGQGAIFVLSSRRPHDAHNLFDLDEPKEFFPCLAPGDRLHFSLRANPVIRRRDPDKDRKSKKRDVVMDALRHIPAGPERPAQRRNLIWQSGHSWLLRQGQKNGFEIASADPAANKDLQIDGYRQHRVFRKQGQKPVQYSSLDFEGELTVTDPARFLEALYRGFGSARSYGCGLMLIRRA